MWRVFLFSDEARQVRINCLIAVFMAVAVAWLTSLSLTVHRIESRLPPAPAAEGK